MGAAHSCTTPPTPLSYLASAASRWPAAARPVLLRHRSETDDLLLRHLVDDLRQLVLGHRRGSDADAIEAAELGSVDDRSIARFKEARDVGRGRLGREANDRKGAF